jgi:hypothetical protein
VDFTTSLRELFAPVATNSHSCIVLPPTNATHFDLKPHVIQLLPSFHGLDHENPYGHVKKFKDICATFKFQNFSEESVLLRLFPFSLHDRARAWLDSNTPGSITSWESLLSKFYNKFFPMSKVNEYRKEISSFTQEEDEKFSESWERFKDLLIKCPPHGYEKWRLVQFFYQGLSQPNRSMIESMNGGAFLSLTGDLAYKALDKLSDSSQVWDFTSCRDKYARIPRKGGIYELKGETEMNMKIDALTKRLDALAVGPSINAANTYTVDSYSICASPMHSAQNCPSAPVFSEYLMEQAKAFNDYRKQSAGPYSETYNPGWRNHPNFSWKQNQGGAPQNAKTQYPPEFQAQQHNQPSSQVPASSPQSALEETMRTFIQSNG